MAAEKQLHNLEFVKNIMISKKISIILKAKILEYLIHQIFSMTIFGILIT
ncbi:hypothetical protein [Terrisporobacter sp.]|nr:hypothetical protein [Terrisporobacter sp.]